MRMFYQGDVLKFMMGSWETHIRTRDATTSANLAKAISKLVEDGALREKMASEAYSSVKEGVFSNSRRRAQLKELFDAIYAPR